MRWKILWIWLVCCSSGWGSLQGCGWDPYWDFTFYRFMEPELAELPSYLPFHYTFDLLYDYGWTDGESRRSANLQAWQADLPGYEEREFAEVVYGLTAGELEDPVDFTSDWNRLAADLSAGKLPGLAQYLEAAYACQPFNNVPSDWGQERLRIVPEHRLITDLRVGVAAEGPDYLKERYAFQLVRLLHYGGYYGEAVEVYEELAEVLPDRGSLIGWWMRSQYAGALHGLERLPEAAYHFSRVFEECPSLRVQAWISFDVPDEATWQATVDLCRDEREVANLYFMRAITPDAVAVEEMENIQAVFPGSDKVDLLLIREVNKLEEELLGYPYGDRNREVPAGKQEQVSALHGLVRRTLATGRMHQPELWRMADAYLDFFEGQPGMALNKLGTMKASGGNSGRQARMLDACIELARMGEVDLARMDALHEKVEALLPELPTTAMERLKMFRDDRFATLYAGNEQDFMAMLAAGQVDDLIYRLDPDLVAEALAFWDKEGKGSYETVLAKRLRDRYSREELAEMHGTYLFAQGRLEEAKQAFERLSPSYRGQSRTFSISPDPFASRMKDLLCESMDDANCRVNKFDKLSLVKTMLSLERKAVAEPDKAAQYYHLLGNAWFNTSYYGYCWAARDYFRSSSRFANDAGNFDVGVALECYQQALEAGGNRELAALTTLMAAKCYALDVYGVQVAPFGEYAHRPYFERLASDFGDTDVYRMAVRECSHFELFVR